ncbi:MAG: hypothetical protein KIT33_12265 [Candidatus Kapabacteria bacterium]|nr:hypothetical protein [Candidatus Kapabacteria bacterium]
MVLAEPVLNNYGQTLLNKGVEISTNHKKILKTWNIATVYIKNGGNGGGNGDSLIDERIFGFVADSLKQRMSWTPELEIEKDLFNSAVMICASDYKEKQ